MTGQDVFNMAMGLMGEVSSTGAINPTDTADYKAQAPAVLSIAQIEIAKIEGVTPLPGVITDLTKPLVISDSSAMTVLPYNLAAHLLLEENPDMAAFFNSKYEELKRKIPATEEPITDVYSTNTDEYPGW
jgi:hypothetical protein